MKNFLKLNIASFFLYFIIFAFFGIFENISFIRLPASLLVLFVILALPGINLVALLQYALKKRFSYLESLALSSISSLLLVPFILSFEYFQFRILSAQLPLLNSLLIFFFAWTIAFLNKKHEYLNIEFLNKKCFIEKFSASYFLWSFFIYLAVISIIITAYFPLPDLDPYYWMSVYSENLAENSLTSLIGYRPLFSSLVYIFNQGAKIDLYALFKYVLPFLTVLIIIPAYLVAEKLKTKAQKMTALLLAFANSSVFLYLQLPIPQSIVIISLFYFVFFLIYSWINSNKLFYFFAGVASFLAYFYHEMASIVFLVWLFLFFIFYGKKLLIKIQQNKSTSLLLLVVFVLNVFPLINEMLNFSIRWSKKTLLRSLNFNLNLSFPAHYTNIDGNAVGWGTSMGVLKYYAYYVGPFFFFLLLIIGYYLIKNKKFRSFVKTSVIKKVEIATIVLLFLMFFSISEVFPRIFNLALLPERSWNFAGIFSIVFLFIFFYFFKNKKKIIPYLIIVSLAINIAGAIYINDKKKYLITSNQLNSARWIKENLPENRIIFSANHKNLLSFHSQSNLVLVDPEFYYDLGAYSDKISKFKNSGIDLEFQYESYASQLGDALIELEEIKGAEVDSKKEDLKKIANRNIANSNAFINKVILSEKNKHITSSNLYIYYSSISKKNPYLKRPYYKDEDPGMSGSFVFDKYPNRFERVYSKNENIIIWKIL